MTRGRERRKSFVGLVEACLVLPRIEKGDDSHQWLIVDKSDGSDYRPIGIETVKYRYLENQESKVKPQTKNLFDLIVSSGYTDRGDFTH